MTLAPLRTACRLLAVAGAAATLVGLAGCVVEERPAPGRRAGAPARQQPAPAGERAELPAGPIARPARGSTLSSHVRVAVTPLGEIEYDGQTLPLASPDGRFVACQIGRSPTWETLLAGPAAEVPGRSEIAIYALDAEAGASGARALTPAQPLPPGLVLGRAADDTGFLVESPRPDGARWIGRIEWLSGRLTWLVQGRDVCAHAVFGPEGALVYTRRAVGAPDAALVLQLADGAKSELAVGGSYAMPLWTGDPGMVHAVQTSADGTAIVGVRIRQEGPARQVGGLGQVVVRQVVARVDDPVIGYQAMSPARSASEEAEGAPPLVFFHPSMERMALLDPLSGRVTGLAPKSIAAVQGADGDGYYCTTPRGLVYWALPQSLEVWSDQQAQPDPEVRVLADPYVPRQIRHAGRTLLIGPTGNPLRLKVAMMELVTEEEEIRD